MDSSKRAVARRLAEAHFTIEPVIERIIQLESPANEEDPKEPIKLLEVNPTTTSDGVVPIFFGAHPPSGISYPSVIIEVTPEEYESICREPSILPNGWRLGPEIRRPLIAPKPEHV
jgi:hypothetical protein